MKRKVLVAEESKVEIRHANPSREPFVRDVSGQESRDVSREWTRDLTRDGNTYRRLTLKEVLDGVKQKDRSLSNSRLNNRSAYMDRA